MEAEKEINEQGVAAVPLLLFLGLVVILVAGLAVVIGRFSGESEPVDSATSTPIVDTARRGNSLKWQGGSLNPAAGSLFGGDSERYFVDLSEGAAAFQLRSESSLTRLTLRGPDGTRYVPGGAGDFTFRQSVDPDSGDTLTDVEIPDGGDGGTWEVVVDNPGEDPTGYEVIVPDPTPPPGVIIIHPGEEVAGSVLLLISIEETLTASSSPVAITGALVTAVITSPGGDLTTLTLTERVAAPGTYAALFEGASEPGLYRVDYTITGQNSAGQQFTQLTFGEFTILPGPDGGGEVIWNQRYDINRSGEIDIIGY